MKATILFASALFAVGTLMAEELQPIILPPPVTEGGKPLMQCLKERRTTREFSAEAVQPQVLSNLLWAAFGINREDGRRTAPSAMNRQEIDVYVFLEKGIFRYGAHSNSLAPIVAGDHRESTGSQDFVKSAPVNLVYVSDFSRMGDMPSERKSFYSAADAGFIAENVYLYCASDGLDCVVRGSVDSDQVKKVLSLGEEHEVILAQTVGYPWKH